MPKTISIFGATGSIGQSTQKVIAARPNDFIVDTLVAANDVENLAQCAIKFNATHAVIANQQQYTALQQLLSGTNITCAAGNEAIVEAAQRPVDVMVAAITGMAGLAPVVASINNCKILALSNKESVVCGGQWLMDKIHNSSTTLIPIDSEHCALHQLLKQQSNIAHVTLTASGGPFLNQENLEDVTPQQAVKHPRWNMGAKISIDSATLMNKGLEVIEAAYLFNLPPEKIKVIVHPQSVVHAMATLIDGTLFACMGATDMQVPISYALYYPNHPPALLSPPTLINLTFEEPNHEKFPCLRLAYTALQNNQCLVLNAANEQAVAMFLNNQIPLTNIPKLVEKALEKFSFKDEAVNLKNLAAQNIAVQQEVSTWH